MSENYQYAECKHCGKSVMEGEIHNCRKMLLTEIADCHATMRRQGEKIVRLEKEIDGWRKQFGCENVIDAVFNPSQLEYWKEQAAIYKDQKQDADEEAERWKKTALAQGEGLAEYIIAKDRYKEALERIANPNVQDLSYTLANVMEVAREALADRP